MSWIGRDHSVVNLDRVWNQAVETPLIHQFQPDILTALRQRHIRIISSCARSLERRHERSERIEQGTT
jgi:hypothetical protein